jgi:methyltransferase of ATP-grasp peptide maturase system
VRSEVTELTPEEQDYARSRLAQLAEQFRADGTLRSPQWEQVFRRTWRHPYVPRYYLDHGAGPLISAAEEQHRRQWLAGVYRDQSLVTKMVPIPTRKAGWYTSSSTMPSLMLTMLQALDLTDGARVLEIGTGSGYQAALLCERLSSAQLLSIDIDPELVELARARLAASGYTPTLAVADGAGGYPEYAPYDRIIATCSMPAIPLTWLEQVTPGGIIMADVRGPLGGTVVRLRVTGDGSATGWFLPRYLSFMVMRPGPETFFPVRPRPVLPEDMSESISTVDPTLLSRDGHISFITQWHLPELTLRPAMGADGQPGTQLDAPDGSLAQVWHTPDGGGFPVRQGGPRRLWDRVQEAIAFWQQAGRPHYDRFGITVTPTEQYVWYDHPDSNHRWPLPTFRPLDPPA